MELFVFLLFLPLITFIFHLHVSLDLIWTQTHMVTHAEPIQSHTSLFLNNIAWSAYIGFEVSPVYKQLGVFWRSHNFHSFCTERWPVMELNRLTLPISLSSYSCKISRSSQFTKRLTAWPCLQSTNINLITSLEPSNWPRIHEPKEESSPFSLLPVLLVVDMHVCIALICLVVLPCAIPKWIILIKWKVKLTSACLLPAKLRQVSSHSFCSRGHQRPNGLFPSPARNTCQYLLVLMQNDFPESFFKSWMLSWLIKSKMD